MDAFVMLGIIPGTNVQISFESWLHVVSVVISALLTLWIYRKRNPLAALIVRLATTISSRGQKLTVRAA